jgi:hypothetical protein
VENGKISFTVFEHIPLSKMDRFYTLTPTFSKNFDYDLDGFRDFIYSYPFGEVGYRTALLSHSSLFSGNTQIGVEGGVRIEVDAYPEFVSKPTTTFRLTGRVISPSDVFLKSNSKITVQTLSRLQSFVYMNRIGETQVKPDGSFEVLVTLSEPARQNAIGANFLLSTTTGTSTLGHPFPQFLDPQASVKWSGSKLQIVFSGMPSSGSQLAVEGPNGKRAVASLEGESGMVEVSGLPASSRILLKSDFYDKQILIPTKFINCAGLWNSFDGGISQSAASKNKGAKTLRKPTVFTIGYTANKNLDKDKDGIVCER